MGRTSGAEGQVVHGRRVFVVGCARSGTTFLQSFLAAHPRIVSLPETKFVSALLDLPYDKGRPGRRGPVRRAFNAGRRLRSGVGLARRPGQLRDRLEMMIAATGLEDLRSTIPTRTRRWRPYLRSFLAILDAHAARNGCSTWVEKTPQHLYHSDWIARHVPGAHFVHIVRAGVDNVASMVDAARRWPEHPFWKTCADLDYCIHLWNLSLRLSVRAMGAAGHTVIRYEALAARPEQVLARLCTALDLEFDAAMLRLRAASAGALLWGGEAWKARVHETDTSARADKFERLFSAEQQAYIRARLLPVPARL